MPPTLDLVSDGLSKAYFHQKSQGITTNESHTSADMQEGNIIYIR